MPGAEHTACTVEMVNMQRRVDVAVIDEIQMIGDETRCACRGWGRWGGLPWVGQVGGHGRSDLLDGCGSDWRSILENSGESMCVVPAVPSMVATGVQARAEYTCKLR